MVRTPPMVRTSLMARMSPHLVLGIDLLASAGSVSCKMDKSSEQVNSECAFRIGSAWFDVLTVCRAWVDIIMVSASPHLVLGALDVGSEEALLLTQQPGVRLGLLKGHVGVRTQVLQQRSVLVALADAHRLALGDEHLLIVEVVLVIELLELRDAEKASRRKPRGQHPDMLSILTWLAF